QARRENGNMSSCAPRGRRVPATIPRGDLRALPAPAQGINPLRIPFWGTAAVFLRPPSPTAGLSALKRHKEDRILPRLPVPRHPIGINALTQRSALQGGIEGNAIGMLAKNNALPPNISGPG